MKKMEYAVVSVICLVCLGLVLGLGLAGCTGSSGGLHIVGLVNGDVSSKSARDAETEAYIMRERYIYTYPYQFEIQILYAQDDAGNIIKDGVEWTLDDTTLGTLSDVSGDPTYKRFHPARLGETIVTATDGINTDTARIIVNYGDADMGKRAPCGIILATSTITYDENKADIWWPGKGVIRFKAGYYTKPDDPQHLATLTHMDELTTDWGEIGPPGDYIYKTNFTQLFLVKARNDAIYAAILTGTSIIYKVEPVAPAPGL